MVAEILTTETPIPPDISDLVIEDDTPVDNFYSEKQQRFLTTILYDSWRGLDDTGRFIAAANVGVFYAVKQPPLVPDVFVSLDVTIPEDWRDKKNRTYLIWEFGKSPDIVIEIVSNRVGNELTSKLQDYAKMGVGYYVVYDPLKILSQEALRIFVLQANRYQETSDTWLEQAGLGLTLWEGEFEETTDVWLRWCDRSGNLIPTGKERAEQAENRAQHAENRAEKLAAKLRALGIDPDANGDSNPS